MAYPDAYREGIELFNAGAYYDCHEVLEGLWMTLEPRTPEWEHLRALIQAAVLMYHLERGNRPGVERLYVRFRRRVERLPARFWGVRWPDLHRALETRISAFLRSGQVPPDSRPRIRLSGEEEGPFGPDRRS